MRKFVVVLLLISLVSVSATIPLKKKLIGVWKIDKISTKGTILRHDQLGQPYIEFNDEGGFLVKISAAHEKGRYHAKGYIVRLKFLEPKKPEQILHITQISDTQMEYTTRSDSAGEVKVICYKMKGGLNQDPD
jgi:hypothetical protein